MKVWDRAQIELATTGSAVGLTTDCATGPGVMSGSIIMLFTHIKINNTLVVSVLYIYLFLWIL